MKYENLSKFKEQIYRCNTCGRCPRGPWDGNQIEKMPLPIRQCPIYETHRMLSFSSQGIILMMRDLLEGKIQPTESLVSDLYECLLCQHCNSVCEASEMIPLGKLECAQMFQALRADLVDARLAPPDVMKKTNDRIIQKHNRMGTEKSKTAWAEGLNIQTQGDIMIFAGCTASYLNKEVLQSLAKVMQVAGLNIGILEDEWCCGAVQHDSGLMNDFAASARHNVDAIKKSGAKEIVMVCADGYKAIKKDYPKVAGELGFDVLHSSELIERLLEKKKINLKQVDLGGKVTYFDPCLLTRAKNGIIEPPRKVLSAIPGIELVEMEGFGKYTVCCGRPLMSPVAKDVYAKSRQDRLEDALAVDAKTMITGCVNCKQSMTLAAKKMEAGIKVMDIAEVVAQALA